MTVEADWQQPSMVLVYGHLKRTHILQMDYVSPSQPVGPSGSWSVQWPATISPGLIVTGQRQGGSQARLSCSYAGPATLTDLPLSSLVSEPEPSNSAPSVEGRSGQPARPATPEANRLGDSLAISPALRVSHCDG
jgi:hypothetical protein